ncbi:glycoside hydrolase family 10 protein [Ktedonospora formicarum]|uniref:Glycosyl hydrolase-like 10 domain-containing protein n=1 Tax=Ktedonospora formicarum TaxID=2778364 RepID=A0A8J3MPA4_9CHLR|nr:family 10 glycosylhydrolase [Ktedonospora formicarum]GHO42715.1 hypothetical protein KSX_08780 [Ktedonospora formicarum]
MRFSLDRLRRVSKLMSLSTFLSVMIALSLLPGIVTADEATKATIQANSNTLASSSLAKRQLRAAWIATVENTDWPSKPGLPAETQKQEYITHLNELQQMRLNAAVVQVRPAADAFYPSQYAPWSQYLTGVQGKDPGYDPLAFMVGETHRRNIEFHAWFNPYRVSMQGDVNKLATNNPARQHPEWVISYGGKLYYNPGEPSAREFIINSILEVVRNYDIDAVHLDDYFYPYKVDGQDFPDNATYQRYGAGRFANKNDWRRDNVNLFVSSLSSRIKQIKPFVKFGISPFGVWRNKSVDPTGSDTTAGVTNYDDLYADTRTWIKNNWLDYIAPQIYWNIGYPAAAYEKLVSWWANEVSKGHVQLYIGQAAYKIGSSSPSNWLNADEMPNQLALNARYPQVQGSIFFSLKDLNANRLGFKQRLINDIYSQPALVPTMSWLGQTSPQPPQYLQSFQATGGQAGVALLWNDALNNTTAYYAVYRLGGNGQPTYTGYSGGVSPPLLVTVARNQSSTQQSFVDTSAQPGNTYTYYITAVDRLHNESQPARGQAITLRY